MFKRLRLRLQDMRTIGLLIPGADEAARSMGETRPGAEHFLLSALKLPDGSAMRIFDRLGASPDQVVDAIEQQYRDALKLVGVDAGLPPISPNDLPSPPKLQQSKPSGQALIRSLYELKQGDKTMPLRGAHVLQVIVEMQYGVVVRTLSALGIEKEALLTAVQDELRALSR